MLLLLIVPYAALALADRYLPGVHVRPATRAKVGLTLVLALTASGHFFQTEGMASMLPPFVPYRTEIVYLTGVLELAGAVGLWLPGMARITGICLVLMFLGFLPVNVYAAVNRIDFGGHGIGPAYLLIRAPFQFLLIGWTWWATGLELPRWERRSTPGRRVVPG
jgi:uncharacterized membrane protein